MIFVFPYCRASVWVLVSGNTLAHIALSDNTCRRRVAVPHAVQILLWPTLSLQDSEITARLKDKMQEYGVKPKDVPKAFVAAQVVFISRHEHFPHIFKPTRPIYSLGTI